MIAQATFTADRKYFEEYYAFWAAQRSPLAKYAIWGIVAIAFAAGLFLLTLSTQWAIALVLLTTGGCILYYACNRRRFWINRWVTGGNSERLIVVEFFKEEYLLDAPGQTQTVTYRTVRRIKADTNGFVLHGEFGTGLFVPKRAFSDADSYERVLGVVTSIASRS